MWRILSWKPKQRSSLTFFSDSLNKKTYRASSIKEWLPSCTRAVFLSHTRSNALKPAAVCWLLTNHRKSNHLISPQQDMKHIHTLNTRGLCEEQQKVLFCVESHTNSKPELHNHTKNFLTDNNSTSWMSCNNHRVSPHVSECPQSCGEKPKPPRLVIGDFLNILMWQSRLCNPVTICVKSWNLNTVGF